MLKLILILLAVVVAVFLYTVYLWSRTNAKLTYMLDSLENDDLNFRFREVNFFSVSLNRLRSLRSSLRFPLRS